jgi:hypothetical protein
MSPDVFDCVMYWNFVRPRAAVPFALEYGDDAHPGFNYKRKVRKPKTDRSMVPGEEEGIAWRLPSAAVWRAPHEGEEEET